MLIIVLVKKYVKNLFLQFLVFSLLCAFGWWWGQELGIVLFLEFFICYLCFSLFDDLFLSDKSRISTTTSYKKTSKNNLHVSHDKNYIEEHDPIDNKTTLQSYSQQKIITIPKIEIRMTGEEDEDYHESYSDDRTKRISFRFRRKFEIEYADKDGVVTQRQIQTKIIKNNGMIEAYCYLRSGYRTFKISRILECIDLETGQIINSSLKDYFGISLMQYVLDIENLSKTMSNEEIADEIKSKCYCCLHYILIEELFYQYSNFSYEEPQVEIIYQKRYEPIKICKEYFSTTPYKYYLFKKIEVGDIEQALKYMGCLFDAKEYNQMPDHYKEFIHMVPKNDCTRLQSNLEQANYCIDENARKIIQLSKIYTNETPEKVNDFIANNEYLKQFFKNSYNYYEEYKNILEATQRKLKLKNIPYAKKLAQAGYGSLEELKQASDEDLLKVSGIGKHILTKIRDFLSKY